MAHAQFSNARLPPRQRELLDALYRRGPSTAEALRRETNRQQLSSTVRAHLRNLERKGAVLHHHDGTRFVYWPVVDRCLAGQEALRYVVDTYYRGSIAQAHSALGSLQGAQHAERIRE
jgi:predicted transcriptional regulator